MINFIYDVIDKITPQDLQKTARKYLNNGIWFIDAQESTYNENAEYFNNLLNASP